MKKFLFILAASVFAALFSLPVLALDQDQEPITVTVTPKSVSLTLSDTSVDYGVVSVGIGKTATSGTVTVTNSGNVVEDFDIKGDSATTTGGAGGSWSLVSGAGSPGQNQFKHSFALGPAFDSFTTMTTGFGDFANSVAASAGKDFELKIDMPSFTSVYGQYTTKVEILATEHGT